MVISKGSYGHEELKNLFPRLGQIPYLPERHRKLPRIMGCSIVPRMEICGTSRPTNPHGTAFSPKQWLYGKEATGIESSKMHCPSRCRYRTYQCVAANYPVTWWLCRVQNGNMRNFGSTNLHGTAFVPKQWLYEKEATGMESSKMYFSSWCRYRTYQRVAANYPVSSGVI